MPDFRRGPGYMNKSNNFRYFLFVITDVKILTLCSGTFKDHIKPWLSSRYTDYWFRGLKELWRIDDSVEQNRIDVLVMFLKSCPSLERLYITIDPSSYCKPSQGKDLEEDTRCTKLDQHKAVYLDGFKTPEEENLWVEQILELTAMKPLIISESHGIRKASYWPNHKNKENGKMNNPRWPQEECSPMSVEVKGCSELCCSRHPHVVLENQYAKSP